MAIRPRMNTSKHPHPEFWLQKTKCMPEACKFYKKSRSCLEILWKKGDTQLVLCWGSTNIWWHCTKFSYHGDLVPRIFASLHYAKLLTPFRNDRSPYTLLQLLFRMHWHLKCSSVAHNRLSKFIEIAIFWPQSIPVYIKTSDMSSLIFSSACRNCKKLGLWRNCKRTPWDMNPRP